MANAIRLAIVLFCAGCAIQSKPFNGPNGRTAYTLRCGAHVEACYTTAAELCPVGYTVFGAATGTAGVPTQIGGTLMVPQHSIAVECM